MKAFIDFYTKEGISPVAQDIEDLQLHFARRHALYRHVGIAPALLRGASVLEFGPGSGHNSIVTAAAGPSRYVLVDANPTGLERTRALLGELNDDVDTEISIVESFIEEFDTDARFDLVLCEGVLPTQEAPTALLTHIAQFVQPGGILLVTCIDAASYLAEQLRRFAAALAVPQSASTKEKLGILVPLLGPHLDTIEGMSRSHEDWILDNVIQPFDGRALMGIDQAIDALHPSFGALATSPSFMVDRRWYKRITGPPSEFNAFAKDCYFRELHNFIDARTEPTTRPADDNEALLVACKAVYAAIVRHSSAPSERHTQEALESLEALRAEIARLDPLTLRSFDAFTDALSGIREGKVDVEWGEFRSWFGQGQQYLSMIRESPPVRASRG